MRTVAELTLGREPDAVPRARRLVRSALGDELPELAGDAELVISELVTNAVLYGEPPIRVRILMDGVVRVEVHDTGRSAPILLAQRTDAMTGRGLSMVAAIAARWGAEPFEGGGKMVWAELTPGGADPAGTPPAVDLDALLEAWADDDPTTATYTVGLGLVSTELLLAAKAHIDNVVRELMLMRAGETSSGVVLPPELTALIETVTVEFAEARAEIKRQAAAAAARGDVLTDLELHLSPSAAEAGDRYLEALDQADRYARSAHLLTLAPPHIHRVFRQWYVRTIVEQLNAFARSATPPPVTPFQVVLGEELGRLEKAAASANRLAMIHRISAELTRAVTRAEMATVAVQRAVEYLGVETARVRLLGGDGILRTVAWRSRSGQRDHDLRDLRIDSPLPGAVAARTGQPVHVRSMVETFGHVPEMEGYVDVARSGHAVPLVDGDETLGVLTLTFSGGELADEAEMDFVSSLAEVLARALHRLDGDGPGGGQAPPGAAPAQAGEPAADSTGGPDPSVRVLAGQKEVLERMVAGDSLACVLDALVAVIESVTDAGGIGSVLLLDDDGRHLRHGAAPSLPESYVAAIDGLEIGPKVGSCGTAAFTRRPVIVGDIATDPLWDDYRDLALPAGLRACWSTPIVAGDGRLLGTFAVYYPQPRLPSAQDQDLIGLLVQTAAVAIERARADRQREAALADEHAARQELEKAHENLRFVLEATTRVVASLDSDDTLWTLARIAVPTVADICLIDLLDGVSFRRAATAAGDAVPERLAARLGSFGPSPAGDHPAAAALRTGRVVLVERAEEEILRDLGLGEDDRRLVGLLEDCSCMSIPLAARGRNLGVMTLVRVKTARAFSEADRDMAEDLGRRVALAIDNTQLYETTREAERRLRLVVRAGVVLTSSLDLDTVASELCALITAEVAELCEVYVRRAPDQWWRLSCRAATRRLIRVDALPVRVEQAVDTRSTVIGRFGPGEALSPGGGVDDEAVATVIPLVAHGEVVGVIAFASPGAEEPTRLPAETVDVIAGRAALAIDNALLYEQERSAAEILQRSLLPHHLPSIAGIRSAARYLPAGARNEIGGDWYDVFDLPGDRLGVVMGDVMGRGIPAASIMGQLRNGLRMLALQDVDPADALQLLNRMLGEEDESPLATVTYGVIDTRARTVTIANAGHLPPLLIRRSESRFLDQKPGLPLGAFPDAIYGRTVHSLEPGDALVLYTDGLIEQRDRSLEDGLQALQRVAGGLPAGDPDAVCDGLLDSFRRDSDEDDTATLVLVFDPV